MNNIDERRNYFLEEKKNELTSRMHKKVYTILNYIEKFLILASTTIVSISISAITFLLGISIGTAIGLKICAISIGIKKYKSIIKKKKKKHDKIVLLAKSKLNRIEVLISKAFMDSSISHDDFVLINNVILLLEV